ncbi:hypothetical protein [Natrinema gelatinilyticum]|nr:hypothetical protein [Natrinema gelatinilyticum]
MRDTGRATPSHLHFSIERNRTHQSIPGGDGRTVAAGEVISNEYAEI